RDVSLYEQTHTQPGKVLLEVHHLSRAPAFSDVSFDVRAGEIVGFAGLVGAGRTEVARCLFGVDRADSGEVTLQGRPIAFDSPTAALQ
ncbi:ATP-binding cassette domain-containing protein, partial [Klebsiella pneumoniae]